MKVESIALAAVISLAFAIQLSARNLGFDTVVIVLFVWAVICGIVLGQKGVRRPGLGLKLAVVPAVVLCVAPFFAALFRALLAVAAGTVPNVQHFFGYSLFDPGWWVSKPLTMTSVLGVAIILCWVLLTLCTLAGGLILAHLSTAYAAGPQAFARVEGIVKRLLAIASVLGVFLLVRPSPSP